MVWVSVRLEIPAFVALAVNVTFAKFVTCEPGESVQGTET